jgi:pimeloyl-ACP methyl ester carboxylesterase
MSVPVVGEVVLAMGTKGIIRRVLEGGLHDPHNLPADLVEQIWQCSKLPGHDRALLSLCRQWRSWLAARTAYSEVEVPVTLVYGEYDWSRPEERELSARLLPSAFVKVLTECGHFASLERPQRIANIVREESLHV